MFRKVSLMAYREVCFEILPLIAQLVEYRALYTGVGDSSSSGRTNIFEGRRHESNKWLSHELTTFIS